jgi:hypothetical protein
VGGGGVGRASDNVKASFVLESFRYGLVVIRFDFIVIAFRISARLDSTRGFRPLQVESIQVKHNRKETFIAFNQSFIV